MALQEVLCMHVSKKILSTILVVFLFFLFYLNITPVNNPDTERMQDFETSTDTIDTLVLGSSLARMGFNTIAYDAISGTESFNLGSSAQDIETSLIVLNDLVLTKQKNIKEIYFLFDPSTTNSPSNEDSIHYIYSHITSHRTKLRMYLSYIKNSKNLFSVHSLQLLAEPFRTLLSKARDAIQPYEKLPDNYKSTYMGKGVLKRPADFSFFNNEYFELSTSKINNTSPKTDLAKNIPEYLPQFIAFCKNNNIQLHVLYPPVPPLCILNKTEEHFANTEKYYQYFKAQNIDYCDYNLLKKEYLSFEPSDFYNTDHLSYEGSTKFTQFLGQHNHENLTMHNADYFYTKQEYLASIDWVDACCFDTTNTKDCLNLTFRALHGSSVQPLYKLVGITGNKPIILLDYSLQNTFTIEHTRLNNLGIKQLQLNAKSDRGQTDQIRSYIWSIQ